MGRAMSARLHGAAVQTNVPRAAAAASSSRVLGCDKTYETLDYGCALEQLKLIWIYVQMACRRKQQLQLS